VIRLEEISKSYVLGEQVVEALRQVDETVEAGEHVAIMGPSGSGKSTLLNVIGCLERPTSGRLWLEERRVDLLTEDELSEVRRASIGFVFQAYHLIERLSAADNVELPLVFAGVPPAERRERATRALEAVGLQKRSRHRPSQLSGGERQRVAIARAVILEPRILLADEPTGNLDRAAGRQILDLLDRLNAGGITLLVVTHDPEVARRAQRVLVLEDGRIVQRLASAELDRIRFLGASGAAP
jgi:putative ABC transport system ATP-binding protein